MKVSITLPSIKIERITIEAEYNFITTIKQFINDVLESLKFDIEEEAVAPAVEEVIVEEAIVEEAIVTVVEAPVVVEDKEAPVAIVEEVKVVDPLSDYWSKEAEGTRIAARREEAITIIKSTTDKRVRFNHLVHALGIMDATNTHKKYNHLITNPVKGDPMMLTDVARRIINGTYYTRNRSIITANIEEAVMVEEEFDMLPF